jgi:predicted RNA-binding protein with RPS1 domain
LAPGVTREGEGAVKSGDKLTVYVVNVANDGKRISLSMREPREPRETSRQRRVSQEGRRAAETHRRGRDDHRGGRPERERTPMRRTFGPEDRKEDEKIKNMSLDQKLNALQDKFRTKV